MDYFKAFSVYAKDWIKAHNIGFHQTLKFLILYGMYSFTTTYALPLLRGFYRSFLRPRANLKDRYGKTTWAVVTGASEGIGQAMALELAKAGFNVVLMARNT